MSSGLNIFEDYLEIWQTTLKRNQRELNQIDKIFENLRKHISSLDPQLHRCKEDLLIAIRFVESFKIFNWIKTSLICGSYSSVFRDLRFLIDSIIQAYYIDLNHFNVELNSKLEILKALSEYSRFYGSELINKIKGLSKKQELRDLFSELSNYVHASYEECIPFIDPTSKTDVIDSLKFNIYNEALLKKCVAKCIEVSKWLIILNEDFEIKFLEKLNK